MTHNTKRTFVFLCGILALGIFFRFYHIQQTPPGIYPDEAMNGSNALEALETGTFKLFYPENNGREGLFINIQALSVKLFGAHPWALRSVSAAIGSLTILGVYLLARELFIAVPVFAGTALTPPLVALFSSFFLATSYWHINFSRIGFRAIMVPLLLSFGLYWLLKAFRTGKLTSATLAGLALGIGFHTYIAWRIVPLIVLILFVWHIWQWRKKVFNDPKHSTLNAVPCAPCIAALVSFFGLLAVLPIGWYFLEHRDDISGRQGQVSVFSAERPSYEFARSTIMTLGMFNIRGDCNERHNFRCAPELYWPVGIVFLLGLYFTVRDLITGRSGNRLISATLLSSFGAMMLPATLTREGLPHALRSIGMIVPTMIIAGIGAAWLWQRARSYLLAARENPAFSERRSQIDRIMAESYGLLAVILILIASHTFFAYHIRFAESKDAYLGFSANLTHIATYLDGIPDSIPKYVIANGGGDPVRGIPISSQPIMFITRTFTPASQERRNLHYVFEDAIASIPKQTPMIIVPLNASKDLIRTMKKEFPNAERTVPEDFVVFTIR